MFCKIIDRGKSRKLYLYSLKKKEYTKVKGLTSVDQKGQHMRWNSLRDEWVFYSPQRQSRTFLPRENNCPLCVSTKDGIITDIPVTEYEIAVFDNRFSALSIVPQDLINIRNISTEQSYGKCEVISYTSDHKASLKSLEIKQISLLMKVWSDRYSNLMKDQKINYVLPFENKGEEIGVTLEHPHGQIYAMPTIPEIIKRQAINQKEKNIINNLVNSVSEDLKISNDNNAISFVPPYARYPYEIWVAPFKKVDCIKQLSDEEINSISNQLVSSIKRLDLLFDEPMPYTMAVYFPPRGFEGNFHHYIALQPMRRDKNKLKFLAGIEQISGLMLSDIIPEDAASKLKSITID